MRSATSGRGAAAGALLGAALAAGACREAKRPSGETGERAAREGAALIEDARRQVEREVTEQELRAAAAPEGGAVHVPSSMENRRGPLLIFLHGLGGSGAGLIGALKLPALADELGFSFMAPEGHLDYSGRRFWNASATCCNFDTLKVDHVTQLAAWIDAAVKHPAVDARRVYIVGYSNGGFMAHRAGCELGGRLRGIVSIAGAASSSVRACESPQALSVVQIHGDADPIVAYGGGHLFADRRRPPHPSAEQSAELWAKLEGCAEVPRLSRDLDLDPRISGAETLVLAYPDCPRGAVELWRIRGGDHSAGLSHRSLRAIWSFIQADDARNGKP